jgi:ribosomal protein S6
LKRPYETIVIFDGTLSEDAVATESKKIEEFFGQNAEFERTEVWGKRQLASMINKKRTGVYHQFLYKGEGNIAAMFDKFVKLNTTVLRHLSVVRAENSLRVAVPTVAPVAKEGEPA